MMKERGNLQEHFKEFRQREPGKSPFFMNAINKLRDLQIEITLTDYFKRCKEAGNLRKDIDPKIVSQIFLQFIGPGPIQTPFMLFGGDFEKFEENIEEMVQAKIEVLLYGIMPQKKSD